MPIWEIQDVVSKVENVQQLKEYIKNEIVT